MNRIDTQESSQRKSGASPYVGLGAQISHAKPWYLVNEAPPLYGRPNGD